MKKSLKSEIAKAIKRIFEGIDQLKKVFPPKKFTIDGRLVGDIGEMIAAKYYDFQPYEGQTPTHDGHTSDGREVQVKATFKDSLTFKSVPDFYLGFKVFNDGKYEEIFNGPGKMISEYYRNRTGIGQRPLSFPIDDIKELSKRVSKPDRIRKRKG